MEGGELFDRVVSVGKFSEPIAKLLFYQMLEAVKVDVFLILLLEWVTSCCPSLLSLLPSFLLPSLLRPNPQYLHDKGITHRDLKVSVLCTVR